MGGAVPTSGAINVDRTDADKPRTGTDQGLRTRPGQVRVVMLAVATCPPMLVPASTQQHRGSLEPPAGDGVRSDEARAGIEDDRG